MSLDPNPILFERASEAILLLNREGQVVKVNREACKALSIQEERLVGKPILGLVVPGDRDRVKQLFLRVLGGQERACVHAEHQQVLTSPSPAPAGRRRSSSRRSSRTSRDSSWRWRTERAGYGTHRE